MASDDRTASDERAVDDPTVGRPSAGDERPVGDDLAVADQRATAGEQDLAEESGRAGQRAATDETADELGRVDEAPDIVDVLRRDHEQAERLLRLFKSGAGTRADWFDNLRETLVRHEVAEELVVYPAVRHVGDPPVDVVEERLSEQAAAVVLLSELEDQALGSDAFRARFIDLRAAVLDHAHQEERTILPALAATKSEGERRVLGQRYERAKGAARADLIPTCPTGRPGTWCSDRWWPSPTACGRPPATTTIRARTLPCPEARSGV